MSRAARAAWAAVKTAVRWALALLILFEQWGWAPLVRLLGRFARCGVIARLERRIARLGPRLALVVLCVPALALLPVKVGALWLVGLGRWLPGLAVLLVAKIVGTGVVARLFLLTRPQLLRLPWFARLYGRWVGWRMRVVASLVQSAGWRAAKALAARLRAAMTPR